VEEDGKGNDNRHSNKDAYDKGKAIIFTFFFGNFLMLTHNFAHLSG
jgi:hypothetical protein